MKFSPARHGGHPGRLGQKVLHFIARNSAGRTQRIGTAKADQRHALMAFMEKRHLAADRRFQAAIAARSEILRTKDADVGIHRCSCWICLRRDREEPRENAVRSHRPVSCRCQKLAFSLRHEPIHVAHPAKPLRLHNHSEPGIFQIFAADLFTLRVRLVHRNYDAEIFISLAQYAVERRVKEKLATIYRDPNR